MSDGSKDHLAKFSHDMKCVNHDMTLPDILKNERTNEAALIWNLKYETCKMYKKFCWKAKDTVNCHEQPAESQSGSKLTEDRSIANKRHGDSEALTFDLASNPDSGCW